MDRSATTTSLIQLVKILEELLFSIPLPMEVIKKYEFMRESAQIKAKVQLPQTKIWALQRTALDRSRSERPDKEKEGDQSKKIEQLQNTVDKYNAAF